MNDKLWFAAKHYGYGWYPVSWEGWLATIGYLILLLVPIPLLTMIFGEEGGVLFTLIFLPYAILLTMGLLIICVKKGEKARWRWGK